MRGNLFPNTYITITCHLIDDDGVLHNFILDTSEMKERHTSDNLLTHIKCKLKICGLESIHDYIPLNFNTTNPLDIAAEAEAEDNVEDNTDYLQELHYYDDTDDEDTVTWLPTQVSQTYSQTQDSQVYESDDENVDLDATLMVDNIEDNHSHV